MLDYSQIAGTLALAVALGCDAFAVGLGVGGRCAAPRQVFRLSFHFGFFQFAMPLVGWLVGGALVETTRTYAPWIGLAVLAFLGGRMIREGLAGQADEASDAGPDPTRGWSLVALSLATSIDALGVGFTLGITGAGILAPAVVIGLVAAGMTWLAMTLGRRLSARLGPWAEVLGGVILVGVGVSFVL